jgi:hypothetical protein
VDSSINFEDFCGGARLKLQPVGSLKFSSTTSKQGMYALPNLYANCFHTLACFLASLFG